MRGAASSKRRAPRGNEGVEPGWVQRLDLPFDIPTRATLRSKKKVLGHYMPEFPVAFTSSQGSPSSPDVDTRYESDGVTPKSTANFWWRFQPGGNVGTGHGGDTRDEHYYKRAPVASITSPTDGTKTLDYRVQDRIIEIRQAMAGGQDGFFHDFLDVPQNAGEYDITVSPSSGGAPLRWRQSIESFEAAAEVNRQDGVGAVIIGLMPDCSTGAAADPTTLADALVYLDNTYPGVCYRTGGKLVYAPYFPEFLTGAAAFHDAVIARLKARGKSVFFIPCFQRTWTAAAQMPTFIGMDHPPDCVARWGDRAPSQSRAENNNNRTMYRFILDNYPGRTWMGHVSVQDQRPAPVRGQNYYESDHWQNLVETWITALGDGTHAHVQADRVQIPTANDAREHAHIMPSDTHGWCLSDLNLWWMLKFKMGDHPPIKRDAVYLSHRFQPTPNVATMTYTGGQTDFMTHRNDGMTLQNTVCVMFFLTEPADAALTIGSRSIVYTGLPAGLTVMREPLLPFGNGQIGVTVTRGGATVARISPTKRRRHPAADYAVSTTRLAENFQYQFWKSLPDPTITLTSNALTG